MSTSDHAADAAADRTARAALGWLAEPGHRTIWSLVDEHGAPAALQRLLHGDVPDRRLRALALALAQAKASGNDPLRRAEASLQRAERIGVRLVIPSDDEWPQSLDDLAALEIDGPGPAATHSRPPLCLWVHGTWPLAKMLRRSVAVIGARAATPYGERVTTEIAYGLAQHGWTVVSGGGFGIDAAAHQGALAAQGRTVAVLAAGIDRRYPASLAGMHEQIADKGLLISEWPPGTEPLRHRYHIRNRVIAAATLGTLLTEAASGSDVTQTMHRALALGRAAMVLPGPVTSVMSQGCHDLLRSQPDITLVTGPTHVLDTVGRAGEHYTGPLRHHGSHPDGGGAR